MEETKNPKCNRCKCYWKPDETDIKSSGLYAKTCKKCRDYQKGLRNKLRLKWKKDENRCNRCGKKLNIDENEKCTTCIEGAKISKVKYYQNEDNKQHKREYQLKYNCENPEIRKNWLMKNKDLIKEYNKYYSREMRENQSLSKYLVSLQRKSIYRCIKLSNLEKTKPSIEYLGCSSEYFIEYFKKKIELFNQYSEIEMNWGNIHIDHIKPVNSFDLDDEDEFLSCCHYTNLQPLLAEINLNKSCKWSDKDDIYWLENIKDKEYYDIYIPN